jgi:hypothetical protein
MIKDRINDVFRWDLKLHTETIHVQLLVVTSCSLYFLVLVLDFIIHWALLVLDFPFDTMGFFFHSFVIV